MNEANQISSQTKLFGFIGEYAGVSRFSAVVNKMFKLNSDDAMMIPMNIREDDLYFTLSNMKKSQVDGAIISSEYTDAILDVLDESSVMVIESGMCDIVFKKDDRLIGDLFSIRVLNEALKDVLATKIAVVGIKPYTKAFTLLSCGFEVSYFHDNLEELMEFTKQAQLKNADINRLVDGMSVDMSKFDAVLDFSDFESFDMIENLPKTCFDMKNSKQFSALKQRAKELDAKYVSYDDMIKQLSAVAYKKIIKG
ncbi:hypothetical protein [Sulfurimonas sp.]|uniref:hypothetical protein n=1 Tax=Sulfurimonas sp. TaxID=2022749 RepID=UPI002B4822C4|nr:hypothetical protein [Sulfurimonas sp.]